VRIRTHSRRNCFRSEQFAKDVQEFWANYSSVAVYEYVLNGAAKSHAQFCISLCYCFLAVIGTIVILCLLFLEILRSCFCYFKSRHVFVERAGMKCHIFFPASFNMSVYSLSNKLISLGIVMLSVSLNWSAYWIFTVFWSFPFVVLWIVWYIALDYEVVEGNWFSIFKSSKGIFCRV
jgi:hypothetical protein